MKKIGYMGAGTWGTALAALLSKKGYRVVVWDVNLELLEILDRERKHPKLKNFKIPENIVYKKNVEEVISDADLIVESVTSKGIRKTMEMIKDHKKLKIPVVITSKGLEKDTGFLLKRRNLHKIIGILCGRFAARAPAFGLIRDRPTYTLPVPFLPL